MTRLIDVNDKADNRTRYGDGQDVPDVLRGRPIIPHIDTEAEAQVDYPSLMRKPPDPDPELPGPVVLEAHPQASGDGPKITFKVGTGHVAKAKRETDRADATVQTAIANLRAAYFGDGPGKAVAEAEQRLAVAKAAADRAESDLKAVREQWAAAVEKGEPTGPIHARRRALEDESADLSERVMVLTKALTSIRETATEGFRAAVRSMIAERLAPAKAAEDKLRADLAVIDQPFWAWVIASREAAAWSGAATNIDRVIDRLK